MMIKAMIPVSSDVMGKFMTFSSYQN
jgi:hypothetical protein